MSETKISQALIEYNQSPTIKNGKQRRLTYSVAKRTQIIADASDNIEIDMNDTDVAMLVFLLSKVEFQTLRRKIYKVAKALCINTSSNPKFKN